MRTVSKKSQKLNDYLVAHPTIKPSEVAKLFKVSVQTVYQRKNKLKSAATKSWAVKNRPSTLVPNAVMSMAVYANDLINSPPHYTVGGVETIDFIEAKQLDYNLGNVVKYLSRANYKDSKVANLKKAQWYLNRAVSKLEGASK